MMISQILKSVHFTKTQKSRYLENETLFFLQTKKFINYIKGYFIAKNSFVVEVTFKEHHITSICGEQLFHSLRARQRSSDEKKSWRTRVLKLPLEQWV